MRLAASCWRTLSGSVTVAEATGTCGNKAGTGISGFLTLLPPRTPLTFSSPQLPKAKRTGTFLPALPWYILILLFRVCPLAFGTRVASNSRLKKFPIFFYLILKQDIFITHVQTKLIISCKHHCNHISKSSKHFNSMIEMVRMDEEQDPITYCLLEMPFKKARHRYIECKGMEKRYISYK